MTSPPGVVEPGPFTGPGGSGLSIHTGADANIYLNNTGDTKSFLDAGPATMVNTSQTLQFVRAYTTGTPSGPIGRWVVRADVIRGLTAARIRDVLALPYLPNSYDIVTVPAHGCLLSGVAGPIMGAFPPGPDYPAGPWGHGGGEQARITSMGANPGCANSLSDLASGAYVHQQALTEHALWYEYTAGGGNKGAIAQALDHAAPVTPYGDMYNVYNALDFLNYGDPGPLRSALSQLAGQPYADFATVEIKSVELFSDALFNRMMDGHDALAFMPGKAPIAAAQTTASIEAPAWTRTPADGAQTLGRGRAWGGGLGGRGNVYNHSAAGGGDETLSLTYTLAGGAAGLDYRVNSLATAGAAFAYVNGGLSERKGADNGGIEGYQGALYAALGGGQSWYMDGLLGYAYGAESLARAISFPGVERTATSAPVSNTFFTAVEGGYTVNVGPNVNATPFARLQVASVGEDAFTETGAGALNLAETGHTTTSARGVIGAQLDSALRVGSGVRADIRARAGWAHDYTGAGRETTAAFAGTPDAVFTVHGARLGVDSLIAQVSISVAMTANSRLFVNYSGDMSGKDTLNTVSGGVRFMW
jgi:uncharacterized protein with beta-barrel porin domain